MRKNRVVLEFSQVLNTLLVSGLTLKDALSVAETVMRRPAEKNLVAALSHSVAQGVSFSQAIEEHGEIFPAVYKGMIRIGEEVGTLDVVFDRLVHYLKNRHTMREKLVSALLYPSVVVVVAVALVVVLSVFVLPRLAEAFSSFGGEAGARLESVFNRIQFLGSVVGVLLVLTIVLGVIGVLVLRARGRAAEVLDQWILRLPGVGSVITNGRVLRWLFALETLVAGGVPLAAALEEAGTGAGDLAVSHASTRCGTRVRLGMPLSKAIDAESVLPERIALWVRIGERTGDIESVFSQLRVYYQEETARWSERFMALIEPVLMIVLGVAMIGMIVGVVLPIFQAFGELL